jgi:hypothetical protein
VFQDKRIRGFLVERKSNKCNALNEHNFNCQGTLDAYYYKGTDTLAEGISCSNELCSKYNKIKYLNDGIKEAGEKK